jgi:hypothetical protein
MKSNFELEGVSSPYKFMNESANALEGMSDTGQFELLATAVLRRAHPDCGNLIHTGINAEGKPIRSPIDGITLIPGSVPPHFVMIQHTTNERPKLREKWLGTGEDIDKAATLINQERHRTPESRLTLILTTNRVPNENLVRDAHAHARSSNIDVDIWDRSRISDFLDNTPDGQWLRHNYLGISQERLSLDLLTKVSVQSTKSFQATVLDSPAAWIDRKLDTAIQSRIEGGHGITFIIMPSGMGKTTALSRLLSRWIANENLGLWIPAEVLQDAHTLDQAIDVVLHTYSPKLEKSAGTIARTFGTNEQPLLLIVDDINHSPRPAALLERLTAWSATIRLSDNSIASQLSAIHILCPVWPQTLEQVPETMRRTVESFAVVHGSFSDTEAIEAVLSRASIAEMPLSRMRASEIATALGNDPLLIAIASPETCAGLSAASVIPAFISQQIAACSVSSQGSFIAGDYHRALGELAWEVLVRHNLLPRWYEILEWFKNRTEILDPLRNLTRQRTLCHIEGNAESAVFVFRHDRVRNAVLAIALNRRMAQDQLPDDVISEPYYADVLGQALVGNVLPQTWIARLKLSNPLALFYALRMFEEPSNDFERTIIAETLAWLDTPEAKNQSTEQLRWAMHAVLAEIDSTVTLQIASRFQQSGWSLDFAKFRNGDLLRGAAVCYDLDPHSNAPYRDALIQHVIDREPALIEKLGVQLTDPELPFKLRIGTLYLAGFIANPNLSNAIATCWLMFGNTPDYLPAFIWAACQCSDEHPEHLLDPIFEYWASLPERDEKDDSKPHRNLIYDRGIQWGFARLVPKATLQYLIAKAELEELRWPITMLIEHVDHPDSIAFIAQERARIARQIEGTGRFSPWLSIGSASLDKRNCTLSAISRERLRQIWEAEDADAHLRERAFELWAINAKQDEIPYLLNPLPIEKLRDRTLQLRVRLGDLSAIPEFRQKIRSAKHPSYWWQFARDFWCAELLEQLDEELTCRGESIDPTWDKSDYDSDWITSDLIMKISSSDAEELLVKHWPHLQYDDNFVQAALFVATPRSLTLAENSIKECPTPNEFFKYLDHRWAIGGSEQRDRLTIDRLNAIEPYLDLLGDSTIHSLWEACNVHAFHEWRRTHLDHRLTLQWSGRCGIDDLALFAELDQLATEDSRRWPDFWLNQFDERGDPPDRALNIVRKWLAARRTLPALQIAAKCIALRGRRSDLEILDIAEAPAGTEADEIRQDARFAVFRRSIV